jgi:hypothetical protein
VRALNTEAPGHPLKQNVLEVRAANRVINVLVNGTALASFVDARYGFGVTGTPRSGRMASVERASIDCSERPEEAVRSRRRSAFFRVH